MEEEFVWECVKCGYIITNTQMNYLKIDILCPRCKSTKASEFRTKKQPNKKEE